MSKDTPPKTHRYLDEAGDTTFYGKGKTLIVGQKGVSLAFIMGMLKINEPPEIFREKVIQFQNKIAQDEWLKTIPSVKKRIDRKGYFLHAKDDPSEIRYLAYNFIKTLDCSFEAVVGRKIPNVFIKKHHQKESVFYADLLSHLLKNKFRSDKQFVLNVSKRGNTTSNNTLESAL